MIALSLFSVSIFSLYFGLLSIVKLPVMFECLHEYYNWALSIYLQPLFIYWHIRLSVFVPLVVYLSFVTILCFL